MRAVIAVLLCALPAAAAAQPSFQLHGFVSLRGIYVEAQPSWLQRGYGRFDVGAGSANDTKTVNVETGQLGADWTPVSWLDFHADGLARREPSGTSGKRYGLVQAFADLYTEKLRLRAGTFWLPTSRENIDPLWTSRYSITDSALNTWIGQEVRPVGVDLQYSPNFYITAGATAFRGNDTMGTLLAARGWTFGNRVSVYDEEIPLPAPDTDRTRPVGRDLDGRNGYAGRLRLSAPERAMIQFTHIDNRASLVPDLQGYTPWRTKFNVVSGDAGANGPATIAAEWVSGSTSVGFPGGSFTMDFDTYYVLLSSKHGTDRWTVRAEHFSTHGQVRSPYDTSRESGQAWTVAWLRDVSPHVRSGIEYAKVIGDRSGVQADGFNPRTGGSTFTVEVRYGF